jgi:hypothetical protein
MRACTFKSKTICLSNNNKTSIVKGNLRVYITLYGNLTLLAIRKEYVDFT